MRSTRVHIDDLPMFASDREIAVAIVGPARAADWQAKTLPRIAGLPGFPAVDEVHGGRPVELIKRFYRTYLGVPAELPGYGPADGPEGSWKRPRRGR